VELHCRSSDWFQHRHQNDEAYDPIILHVVFEHDQNIFRKNGSMIPTLELAPLVDMRLWNKYRDLMETFSSIPCERSIGRLDRVYIKSFLPRLLIESLQVKTKKISSLLEEYKGSWEDAFYVRLSGSFGFNVNTLPFELLARTIPRNILAKHAGHSDQVQALLFGGAGFLAGPFSEAYPERLRNEFIFLQKKYALKPLDLFLWKFGRLRPSNFPTVRIAQLGSLLTRSTQLLASVLETTETEALQAFFATPLMPAYWQNHYHFAKESAKKTPVMGVESVNNILSNTVAPFLFSYGSDRRDPGIIERAVNLLEVLPAETNQVTRYFAKLGVRCASMAETKALLYLKKVYCDNKKCLNCEIGIRLLKREP
jgi:hypothetical protein